MSAPEQAGTTAPVREPEGPPLRPRRMVVLASVGILLALLVPGLIIAMQGDESADPAIAPRADPVADLLAWIPANDQTRRAFAAWTVDIDGATPVPPAGAAEAIDRLGLEPAPRALGRSPSWAGQFGWHAGQVTGWAAAGDGSLAVLAGDFDEDAIAGRLLASGYHRSRHRGADLFVLGGEGTPTTAAGGANAVALLGGRLIVGASVEEVRAAINAAVDGTGSLADEPAIGAMLRSMAPLSALAGIAQADLAASCHPNAIAPASGEAGTSNYALVGYGRFAPGEMRRTLVAVSFPDPAGATAALPGFETGWISGFANAGGAGGSLDAFGRLTVVSQTGNLLIAEIVEGRDAGWVRAGIRYAIPVCEAALALAPPATPVPAGNQAGTATMERLVASLPETGRTGRFRAIDFEATTAPGPNVTVEEIAAWRSALAPLPPFAVLPSDPAAIESWARLLGIPLAELDGVAEAQASGGQEPVGVLIGAWNRDELTARLSGLGYQWVDIGEVRHFAVAAGRAAGNPLLTAAGAAWTNIAVAGDRLWVSADQRSMRQAIAESLGEQAPPGEASPVRAAVLGLAPDVTAVEITGIDLAGERCGPVLPGLLAVAATWTAAAGGAGPALTYLLDGTVPSSELASELEGRIARMTLTVTEPGTFGPGTPVPTSSVPLPELLRSLGTERARTVAGPAIVARFSVLDRSSLANVALFESTSGDCRLATVL